MDLRSYVKELVYGANDGIVTTFAVVSGVVGGGLSARVVVVVGLASLFADGFSMAASDYLSNKTEQAAKGGSDRAADRPLRGAAATFVAFVVAGALPLLPYLIPRATRYGFPLAAGATALALVLVGSLRTRWTHRSALRGGGEMLLVGGAASAIAYGIGRLLRGLADAGVPA
jgi:VIT1/CCC1 family predicted Fe2+/Mn2+ transporter